MTRHEVASPAVAAALFRPLPPLARGVAALVASSAILLLAGKGLTWLCGRAGREAAE